MQGLAEYQLSGDAITVAPDGEMARETLEKPEVRDLMAAAASQAFGRPIRSSCGGASGRFTTDSTASIMRSGREAGVEIKNK